MKRVVLLILSVFVFFLAVGGEQKIAEFEKEIKRVKNMVAPSVVKVVSENHKKYVATGIAVATDLILTSTLITRHPYEKIYILTASGKRFDAKILGRDRRHSLIVLKLKDKVMKPVKISSDLDVGDWIALVGVFYDKFPSIIQGIVSSLSEEEMILNAPVFPGASGGAVVNKRGELVAVIRGRFGIAINPDISIIDREGELIFQGPRVQARNLCYAVPAKKVMEATRDIEKYGQVQRGWLGIFFRPAQNGQQGLITLVVKNSPAEQAGLKPGDIITAIDGNLIRESSEISRIVQLFPPGKVTTFDVIRNKTPLSIPVKIGTPRSIYQYDLEGLRIRIPEPSLVMPETGGKLPQVRNFILYRKGTRSLGIDVMALTPELAEKFSVREGFGLMIAKVYDDSPARKAGLVEGDIIVRANGIDMRALSDIQKELGDMAESDTVFVEFYRDGRNLSLRMKPDVGESRSPVWNDFFLKLDLFSRYFGETFRRQYQRMLNQQLDRLKNELEQLKISKPRISAEDLRWIEEEIVRVRKDTQALYSLEMNRIQEQEKQINEDSRKGRAEELRLLKEIEQIRKKIREKTEEGGKNS